MRVDFANSRRSVMRLGTNDDGHPESERLQPPIIDVNSFFIERCRKPQFAFRLSKETDTYHSKSGSSSTLK